MRVENLDSARSRAEMIEANLNELRWLGLTWDEGPDVGGKFAPYVQSERHELYQEALERLETQQKLFECYLSRKDLREIASAPHGELGAYGDLERALNDEVREEKRLTGKTPSLRFRTDGGSTSFTDLLQGEQTFQVGDFVVKRADGEWAYQLAVVVDDIAMNITEVVRGADLLESTAAQILLYRALDAAPPVFFARAAVAGRDRRAHGETQGFAHPDSAQRPRREAGASRRPASAHPRPRFPTCRADGG